MKGDWMSAYGFCKSIKMSLAALRDQSEWQQFTKLCLNSEAQFEGTAFISGTRSAGSWVWFDTGKQINYALPWFAGEPNNVQNNEYCMEVGVKLGKFGINDSVCSGSSRQFICETAYTTVCTKQGLMKTNSEQ
jgi:Lectin C-type domain